jgi:hypothetical protein
MIGKGRGRKLEVLEIDECTIDEPVERPSPEFLKMLVFAK